MKSRFASGAFFALMACAATPQLALAHAGEAHAAAPQSAQGVGVITVIDAQKATVTIRHEPIAALKWPAMTMKFPVQSADLLKDVAVGAKVDFTLVNHDGKPMISEIHVK